MIRPTDPSAGRAARFRTDIAAHLTGAQSPRALALAIAEHVFAWQWVPDDPAITNPILGPLFRAQWPGDALWLLPPDVTIADIANMQPDEWAHYHELPIPADGAPLLVLESGLMRPDGNPPDVLALLYTLRAEGFDVAITLPAISVEWDGQRLHEHESRPVSVTLAPRSVDAADDWQISPGLKSIGNAPTLGVALCGAALSLAFGCCERHKLHGEGCVRRALCRPSTSLLVSEYMAREGEAWGMAIDCSVSSITQPPAPDMDGGTTAG